MPRTGVMLARAYTSALLDSWHVSSFIIQPKINGLRCRAVISQGKVTLYSSEANEIVSVPHINKALSKAPTGYIHLDGELYCHGMPLQDIRSIVSRTANLHPDHERIQYHIFDVVLEADQELRLGILGDFMDNLPLSPYIVEVPSSLCVKANINETLQEHIDRGYEGIILRCPHAMYHPAKTNFLLKLKPRHEAHFTIVGAFEAISLDGFMKNTLGGFNLVTADGKNFHCGAGMLNHTERQFLWDAWKKDPTCLLGGEAFIYYQELSKAGIPQQPILRYVEGL